MRILNILKKQKNKNDEKKNNIETFNDWLNEQIENNTNNKKLVYNFTYNYDKYKNSWYILLIVTNKIIREKIDCINKTLFMSEEPCEIYTDEKKVDKMPIIIKDLVFNYLNNGKYKEIIKNSKAICLGLLEFNTIYNDGHKIEEIKT